MKERKSMMREKADAFIALPGGWGTLEEITEVITLKQLGIHNKPVIFLNTNDFYEYFFLFISNIRKEGFVSEAYDGLYVGREARWKRRWRTSRIIGLKIFQVNINKNLFF